ncbi:peptidoglycan DD-metalloendopeptidase family protein [Nostocaceae cyanobacterium CENA369]|uniref:Peptidoglycan DD-metalloendopeptidase family protein n=1 Tax=Dendronalium phyllosphericum CENA369 TaxID=1725256 RepID=A0A8J7I0H1_9NOST|nr:peptidoglycan DD-metalloendopeptidase family protein [Dendronalium phyllosphericum]MBH8571848.1 peptidoglycan DD-metalloendopeptidase family protein [Dendronalium phyllosphericum CENA369]
MKRALKKRVKAVLKNTPSNDDAPAKQLNVVNQTVVNRRARTKAAVIGLAISMGATSLLVTRQSDRVQAAAPVGSQKAASSIPVAPDTEVKFANTKLKNKLISSASVPENPVIVEPTAISQLPGLEAKLQVAASGISVQVPTSETSSKTAYKTSVFQQPQLLRGVQAGNQSGETVEKLSSTNGVANGQTAFSKAQPQTQTQQNTVASGEINVQLKAQQELALNNLQEKSNRLRKSLAELRSGESKNLSQSAIKVAQAKITETTQENLPPLSASSTVIEQSSTLTEAKEASVLLGLKQPKVPSELMQQVATTPAPATPKVVASSNTTAYEVKPGDTLAAIASRYNTSVSELAKANNLSDPNQLKISQTLIIPAARIERSNVPQTSVAIKPYNVQSQSNSNSQVVTSPANAVNIYPNLSAASQLPVLADNSSITVPTAQTAKNQVQPNTAIAPKQDPANTNTHGLGGDTPVPTAFAEMQLARKPEQKVAAAKNERLRTLQAEIQRLQEKYRAQQSGNIVASAPNESESNSAAVPIPVASPNNFAVSTPASIRQDLAVPIAVPSPIAPSYSNQSVKPQFRANLSVDEPVNPEFLPNQATRLLTPGKTSGIGNIRGTTVTPKVSLPPLAAVDQYLPKPIDETIPPPSTSTVAYIWPAKGVMTSGYGWRWGRMHKGIDVANATGTPVYASSDGVIQAAGWNKGGYGNLVDIRHADGSMTRYGHNSKILVRIGQQVHQGQTIALMGSTGFSTGPHSHFEIHPSGKGAVNPIAMLPPAPNRI